MSQGVSGLAELRKSAFDVIPSHLQYDAHELLITFPIEDVNTLQNENIRWQTKFILCSTKEIDVKNKRDEIAAVYRILWGKYRLFQWTAVQFRYRNIIEERSHFTGDFMKVLSPCWVLFRKRRWHLNLSAPFVCINDAWCMCCFQVFAALRCS